MINDDEDHLAKSTEISVGEDLSKLSVDELEKRITLLNEEILRVKTEMSSKQASKSAADKFFS